MAADYVISGVKQFITSGKMADVAIVIAVTDKTAGKKGMSAFIGPPAIPATRWHVSRDKLGQYRQRYGADQFRTAAFPPRT